MNRSYITIWSNTELEMIFVSEPTRFVLQTHNIVNSLDEFIKH